LLVTKLGTNTSQYNIDNVSPLASSLYWDNPNARLGIGTTTPLDTLEVLGTGSFRTQTYNVGSACQGSSSACTATGTTVYGTGTTWTSAMVGDTIVFADGTSDIITAFTSATQVTVSTSRVKAASTYKFLETNLSIAAGGVQVGSATTDASQVDLQLDSYNTYADSGTCSTTVNQGALYYNTASGAVRGCVNGVWEDMVTTGGLGMIAFGIIPDSGSDPGDLVSTPLATPGTGPCKVYQGSTTTSIRWTGCTVYSSGRKVVIADQASNVATSTTNGFRHLCVNATTGVLEFFAASQANDNTAAGLPTFNAASPVACMATVQIVSNVISRIYDTRFFTTTVKQAVNIITTGASIGQIVVSTGTHGSFTPSPATAGTGKIAGIVVATAGSTTANTVNAIIAVSGPIYVKAIGGTINDYVQTSGTAGYATTNATVDADAYANIGLAQSAFTTTCGASNADTCRGSIFTILSLR